MSAFVVAIGGKADMTYTDRHGTNQRDAIHDTIRQSDASGAYCYDASELGND
jgi:hypothetical protein